MLERETCDRYFCMEPNGLSGETSNNYFDVTCGDDGVFPTGWPQCDVRCAVPNTPSGFAEPGTSIQTQLTGTQIKMRTEK